MDQTLGKRIAANRKRMGMTQDALAEQLGITAQAVSKWENDQSCPDITMLPRLAEIFGITTDALLGRAASQPVHEAEVLPDEEYAESDGLHIQKGGWEFKWDGGKRSALAAAILVLLVGALMLASRLFHWGASFWDILWPTALLVYGVKGLLSRFSFFSMGMTLFGGYFLIAKLNIWELDLGSELVFPIILLIFGLSLLVDALRKPGRSRFLFRRSGSAHHSKEKNHYAANGECFDCSLSFGEAKRRISLPRLSCGSVNVSFGELTVDLSGCEEIGENCRIDASCAFGELLLLVPQKYRVDPDTSTAFGELSVKGTPDPIPSGVIAVDANVSFGQITIRYI